MARLKVFYRLAYSPLNVQLVVCRRCNLSCGYCNEYDKRSEPVDIKVLKQRTDRLSDLGTFSLVFTGGEPLLHPKLPDLVRYARKRIVVVGMITNAYLLTESIVEKLNRGKLSGMQISIDGVKPNNVTVKVLDLMRWRLKMLASKAKFRVNVNSVIGATNPSEALEVARFARRLGFTTTVGLIHDGRGKIKLTQEQMRVYRQLEDVRKKPFWDYYNFEREFIEKGESDFKCRAGSRYLYVDEFGIVRYCSQQKSLYGKRLERMSYGDLKESFNTKKPCSWGCTVGCVRRSSWLDGWRRQ